MGRIIKVGIIGCGSIANRKHMPALQLVQDCEMVAFCDLVEERAQSAATAYGAENAKVYTDYTLLLQNEEVEVVHVCTPNCSHSVITIAALEAGKHVMCEKPMAMNSQEAEEMLEAAKRTGKKLTIGYQSRFRDDVQYLKKEAEDGTFGDMYFAKATALRRRGVPNWGVFLDEAEQGGGALIDIGTHALDLTLWILNNYRPRYCVGTAYHALNALPSEQQANKWGDWDAEKFKVEDSAFGFVVMENGATIMLESAWALNTLDVREAVTSVCGTKAGADMMDGLRINGVRHGTQYVLKPDFSGYVGPRGAEHPIETASEREARLWIEAVRNDTTPLTLPEQALCVTRILDGIYKSAKTGEPYYF